MENFANAENSPTRRTVNYDEYYPFYFLVSNGLPRAGDVEVELTEEEVRYIRHAERCMEDAQEILKTAYQEAKTKEAAVKKVRWVQENGALPSECVHCKSAPEWCILNGRVFCMGCDTEWRRTS